MAKRKGKEFDPWREALPSATAADLELQLKEGGVLAGVLTPVAPIGPQPGEDQPVGRKSKAKQIRLARKRAVGEQELRPMLEELVVEDKRGNLFQIDMGAYDMRSELRLVPLWRNPEPREAIEPEEATVAEPEVSAEGETEGEDGEGTEGESAEDTEPDGT